MPFEVYRRSGRAPLTNEEMAARWIARLLPTENGCLEWHGARDPNGYGRCGVVRQVPGRPVLSQLAHRALWVLVKGPLSPGVQLDHLCRNPPCCNLDHLEPVSAAINTERSTSREATLARWAARTHCRHGHEYAPENTRRDPQGTRHCRICDRAASARRSARRAARRVAELGQDPGPLSRRHVNKH